MYVHGVPRPQTYILQSVKRTIEQKTDLISKPQILRTHTVPVPVRGLLTFQVLSDLGWFTGEKKRKGKERKGNCRNDPSKDFFNVQTAYSVFVQAIGCG